MKKENPKLSEDKYRKLVENSPQGLAIIQDWRIVFCNNMFASILGYPTEELLSYSPHSLDKLLHPNDRAIMYGRYCSQLAGEITDPFPLELRGVRKNSKPVWLSIHTSESEHEGKPALQVVCMDITAYKEAAEVFKEAREYLYQIINRISDPIFVKDREHRFVLLNDAMCSIIGRPREEMIGWSRMPDEIAQKLWEQEEVVFESGEECVDEQKFEDMNGIAYTLMAKKSLLTLKDGQKQIVGILRDISEYKRLEAQFLQSQKMEAIGVLAGGVAHDFNNLLNVINGYAELVLGDLDPDDPSGEDIKQILDAGQRAAVLTSQLLAFSRKQILQPEVFNLNQVIAGMSSMISRLIGEDITTVTNFSKDPIMMKADIGKIQQVVMNLVVNARDAMPSGGKLTIETGQVDFHEHYIKDYPVTEPGPYAMLAISDNGIGMDDETRARVFEPFFTTKAKDKGTGLGLSTVYGIVKQSDGAISVYSELGHGTTIKVYFPRLSSRNIDEKAEPGKYRKNRGEETVLIVEDEKAVRSLIRRILEDNGYQVLEATDGRQAIHIARDFTRKIHMVITDVIMPEIGGRVLVSQLEDLRPGIKSLYISGYTDNAIVDHGILDSNVAFLQKPFTVEKLNTKVREVLDS